MARYRVYKHTDGWQVDLPRVGFATSVRRFDSHGQALAWVIGDIAARRVARNLHSSVTAETWGPWTVKRPRV